MSFIGYHSINREIVPGSQQVINVSMAEDSRLLNEVVIKTAKKVRYRNKNNPAVDLIRQVIANKNQNRLENIFKILRLDYVKRFSYLDHPNITKSGVRL